jgi:hypothetical protein
LGGELENRSRWPLNFIKLDVPDRSAKFFAAKRVWCRARAFCRTSYRLYVRDGEWREGRREEAYSVCAAAGGPTRRPSLQLHV